MHEMALASNVVDAVVSTAVAAGAQKVTDIQLRIGLVRDIVDELFEGLVKHLSRGTVAEEAEVTIVRVPLTVRCADCGAVHPVDYRNIDAHLDCPYCHSGNYQLNSGMEFDIDRIGVA